MMDEQTIMTGEYEGDYPPDDSPDTWHVHEDSSWAWGIECDYCAGVKNGKLYANTAPLYSIGHLRRQNQYGTTSASEEREVLSGVKPEDRDKIGRAR